MGTKQEEMRRLRQKLVEACGPFLEADESVVMVFPGETGLSPTNPAVWLFTPVMIAKGATSKIRIVAKTQRRAVVIDGGRSFGKLSFLGLPKGPVLGTLPLSTPLAISRNKIFGSVEINGETLRVHKLWFDEFES